MQSAPRSVSRSRLILGMVVVTPHAMAQYAPLGPAG
jgi:hypothetical protein